MFSISHDAFDSDILGMKIGKIEITNADDPNDKRRTADFRKILKTVKRQLKKEAYEYATLRFPLKNFALLSACEQEKMKLVDVSVMMSQEISRINEPIKLHTQQIQNIRDALHEDIENIAKIAKNIYVHNRLFNDPIIPDTMAHKFYQEWARNCVRGIAAKKTLVYVEQSTNAILGFIGLKKNGHVSLIGVSKKSQGLGIGRRLIQSAIAHFTQQGLETIYIDTQAHNIPAIRLYEKSGYRMKDTFVTMRIHLT